MNNRPDPFPFEEELDSAMRQLSQHDAIELEVAVMDAAQAASDAGRLAEHQLAAVWQYAGCFPALLHAFLAWVGGLTRSLPVAL
ncbi:hypothetical protein [Deinococcus sp. 23YEL01]|uniref:hypothetical protein n=1 Tax=Deinococcus sp. 23YEL01 TaxID=2745871 RepID=UPI001E49DAE2|nr:hypothetical protein [Deinococcus sp. 23YEL01]MCD0168029.1 hypothetical protein [Deinococcus sp. 23YEL01]